MYIKSVIVDDQDKALKFYTEKMGFEVKHDIPMGQYRWITVVSPNEPDGVELGIEPNAHEASKVFQKALMSDGIPWTAFQVDDLEAEVERLESLGVEVTQAPTNAGTISVAVINDTCGNLIQLLQVH